MTAGNATDERRGETGSDSDEDLPGICVVTHPLAPPGENATRTLLEILSALTAVSLVTAHLAEDSPVRDDHEVIEVSKHDQHPNVAIVAVQFLVNQVRMCRAIYRRDEEVVLFFGATSYLLPIVFSRLLGRTVVVEPRSDGPLALRLEWEQTLPSPVARFLAGCVRLLDRAGYRVAHGVVTYTPNMARQLGLDPESPRVHPEGARYVDTDRFSVATPYEERDRVVGFLGRIDEEKGIRTLAGVARRLPDDVTMRFVGDGDLREWLCAELDDEIQAGRVELAGWVDHDEVPAELDGFRLLVMPSTPTEGLPTTILEAMACGTPVYATPVSGVPDVVREGETGFLIEERDPDVIASQIESILDRDLAAMSDNCRDLAVEEYSFEAAVERYRGILLSLPGTGR